MIQLQNITKTYTKGKKKAVDDLTLHVEGGELFGFIGPNGAGKTTTIKLMTGILTPDQGTITMAGHRMDQDRLAAQRLIGFVPDGNVWILDEPLGGLDPRAAHLLKEEMIRHCNAGNTVFFSTHVLEVAEKLCTRIGIIADGSLKAIGTLDELRSGEIGASLEDLFLELTDKDETGESDGGETK